MHIDFQNEKLLNLSKTKGVTSPKQVLPGFCATARRRGSDPSPAAPALGPCDHGRLLGLEAVCL